MPEVQSAPLTDKVSKKVAGAISFNISTMLGLAVILVIAGSFLLSWFDKEINTTVIMMGVYALAILGQAINGQLPPSNK